MKDFNIKIWIKKIVLISLTLCLFILKNFVYAFEFSLNRRQNLAYLQQMKAIAAHQNYALGLRAKYQKKLDKTTELSSKAKNVKRAKTERN